MKKVVKGEKASFDISLEDEELSKEAEEEFEDGKGSRKAEPAKENEDEA